MTGLKALRRHDVMTSKRRGVKAGQRDRGLGVAFLAMVWGLAMAVYELLILACRLVGWLAWFVVEFLDDANDALARSTADRSNRVMYTPAAPAPAAAVAVLLVEQDGAAA